MNRNPKTSAFLRSVRCRFAREQRRDEGASDRFCRFSRLISCELKVVADFVRRIIKRKRATRATFAAAAIALFVGISAIPTQADPTIEEEILQAVSNALYIAVWDHNAGEFGEGGWVYMPLFSGLGNNASSGYSNTGMGIYNFLEDYYNTLPPVSFGTWDGGFLGFYLIEKGLSMEDLLTNRVEWIEFFVSMSTNKVSEDLQYSPDSQSTFASFMQALSPDIAKALQNLANANFSNMTVSVSNDDSRILRKMDEILDELRKQATNETREAILEALQFITNNWDGVGCSCGEHGSTNENDRTNMEFKVLLSSNYFQTNTGEIMWQADEDGYLHPHWADREHQPSYGYESWAEQILNQWQDGELDFSECVTMFLQMQASLQMDILSAHKILYDALFNGTNGVITEVSELEQLQTEIQTQNQELESTLNYGVSQADISEDSGFLGRFKAILQRSFSPDQFDGVITLRIPKFKGDSASDEYIVEIDTNQGGWQKFRSFMRFSVGVLWGLLLWWIIRHVLILALWFVFRAVEWALSVFGWQFKPLGALVDFLRAIS